MEAVCRARLRQLIPELPSALDIRNRDAQQERDPSADEEQRRHVRQTPGQSQIAGLELDLQRHILFVNRAIRAILKAQR